MVEKSLPERHTEQVFRGKIELDDRCAPRPGSSLCAVTGSASSATAPTPSPRRTHPRPQGRFTGGTIQFVEVTVEEEQYRDLEREMAAAMAVD